MTIIIIIICGTSLIEFSCRQCGASLSEVSSQLVRYEFEGISVSIVIMIIIIMIIIIIIRRRRRRSVVFHIVKMRSGALVGCRAYVKQNACFRRVQQFFIFYFFRRRELKSEKSMWPLKKNRNLRVAVIQIVSLEPSGLFRGP